MHVPQSRLAGGAHRKNAVSQSWRTCEESGRDEIDFEKCPEHSQRTSSLILGAMAMAVRTIRLAHFTNGSVVRSQCQVGLCLRGKADG